MRELSIFMNTRISDKRNNNNTIWIGKSSNYPAKAVRNNQICAEYLLNPSLSCNKLARKYNVSAQRINLILKQAGITKHNRLTLSQEALERAERMVA